MKYQKNKKTIFVKTILYTLALFLITGCGANKKSQITNPNAVANIKAGSTEDLRVNVGDRIFFEVNQAALSPEAQQTLIRQAAWFAQFPNVNLTIEGHADERGTREYNLALSARRAETARQFLIQNGVETTRIDVISYGKERPVSLCDAESCWSQNRRAVSIIKNQTPAQLQ